MIKQLLKSLRDYGAGSFLAPVMVAAEVVLGVIVPLITAAIIDNGIEKGDMNYILRSGGVLFVVIAFSFLFGALSGKYAAIASVGFAKNLRRDMYNNIQDFSFSNIDRFSTSSLITRMTTDVSNVQNAYLRSTIPTSSWCLIMEKSLSGEIIGNCLRKKAGTISFIQAHLN